MSDQPKFKIEKGIAMPIARRHSDYPWLQMKIGDSFLTDRQRRSNLYNSARASGIKVSIRNEGDGIRVWRVE